MPCLHIHALPSVDQIGEASTLTVARLAVRHCGSCASAFLICAPYSPGQLGQPAQKAHDGHVAATAGA
eukprot:170379-Pelagomonas_calceolata.AAC.7